MKTLGTLFLATIAPSIVGPFGSTSQICAQAPGFVVPGGAVRKTARLLYTLAVDRPGELFIHYGAPTWRATHAAEIAKKDAAHFRLGTGFWAALHSNLGLDLGGKNVPANIWYLGLHRSADSDWSLTLMDSSKIARSGAISGSTRDIKPDIVVPMRLATGKPMAKELEISFHVVPKSVGRGSLRLRWGEVELTTDFVADVVEHKPKGEPAFAKLNPKRTTRTASGLRFEELRPGAGRQPKATDRVELHYVGWLEDGTRFDSSFLRKQTAEFPVQGVVKGFGEGIMRMKPGAEFLLHIPPELGYGARGAGPIKPDSPLIFWVQLRAIL